MALVLCLKELQGHRDFYAYVEARMEVKGEELD